MSFYFPYILEGRTFEVISRNGEVVMLAATGDDVSWALTRLGQYVRGIRVGLPVRAYVYSAGSGTITILVEHP